MKIRTFAELSKILPRTKWYWKDWLPQGYVTLIAADPGVGKSALALDIANHLLLNKPWPDGQAPADLDPAIRIVFADTESSQVLTIERCQKWGVPLDRLLEPTSRHMDPFKLSNPRDCAQLEALVKQEKPALVIIDSLRMAVDGDENQSKVVAEPLSFLAKLARDYQIAIILVHHLRKGPADQPTKDLTLDMVRGSTAIAAMCRVIWGLVELNPNTKRLKVIKSNLAKPPAPLSFSIHDDLGLLWDGQPHESSSEANVEPSELERAKHFISTVINFEGGSVLGSTVEQRAEGDLISYRTLRRAREELGIKPTKRPGDGKYIWTLP